MYNHEQIACTMIDIIFQVYGVNKRLYLDLYGIVKFFFLFFYLFYLISFYFIFFSYKNGISVRCFRIS